MRFKISVAALIFALTLTVSAHGIELQPCADTAFSQFTNGITVSVSGKVKTIDGRGIKGARVVLKDADTNEVIRSAISSPFGYYRLDEIEAGRFYVLSVSHKRYIFAFPAQLIELNENRTGLDFLGEMNE